TDPMQTRLEPRAGAEDKVLRQGTDGVRSWRAKLVASGPKSWIGLTAAVLLVGLVGLWAGGGFSHRIPSDGENQVHERDGDASDAVFDPSGQVAHDQPTSVLDAADASGEIHNGWLPLCDGEDLAGWEAFPDGTRGWQLSDGVLKCSSPEWSTL